MTLQKVSSEEGARKILRRLVDSRLCQIEDFDAAPKHHLNPAVCCNLLREQDRSESIEIISPRDLAISGAGPGLLSGNPSLSLPRPMDQSFSNESCERQNSSSDGKDHEFSF